MRSYRTVSPLPVPPKRPSAVCSLLHFPSPFDARALPGTLPCGARTFLQRPKPPAILTRTLMGMLMLRAVSGKRAGCAGAVSGEHAESVHGVLGDNRRPSKVLRIPGDGEFHSARTSGRDLYRVLEVSYG